MTLVGIPTTAGFRGLYIVGLHDLVGFHRIGFHRVALNLAVNRRSDYRKCRCFLSSIIIYHHLPSFEFPCLENNVSPIPAKLFFFQTPIIPIPSVGGCRVAGSRLLTPSFFSLASTSFCAARIPSTWQHRTTSRTWSRSAL